MNPSYSPSASWERRPVLTEGALREQLAAYFLSVPPREQQTNRQRREYRQALRRLSALETRILLQNRRTAYPLSPGNPAGLLRDWLQALQLLADELLIPLHTGIAPGFPEALYAGLEPRLMLQALTGLVRASCLANPQQPVDIQLSASPHLLIVTIQGARPPRDPLALQAAKKTARLHKGNLAVSSGAIGWSCHRQLTETGGFSPSPSAQELLGDPFSCLYVDFYASVPADEGSSCAGGSSESVSDGAEEFEE